MALLSCRLSTFSMVVPRTYGRTTVALCTIDQGEGGEQGDPLMPLLFAVGQHPALVATQERLEANEWIFRIP